MPSNNINSHTHKEINIQIAVIVEIHHILKKIKQNHDPLVSSHPYTIISHLTKMYSLILSYTHSQMPKLTSILRGSNNSKTQIYHFHIFILN